MLQRQRGPRGALPPSLPHPLLALSERNLILLLLFLLSSSPLFASFFALLPPSPSPLSLSFPAVAFLKDGEGKEEKRGGKDKGDREEMIFFQATTSHFTSDCFCEFESAR